MTAQTIFLALGGLVAGAAITWWLTSRRRGGDDAANIVNQLQHHVTERLDRVTEQVDQRLRENTRAINESKSFITDRVSSTERSVREVTASLSKLENATTALKSTADEISSFQQLLKSPKVRGGFGEVLLTNLLAEVLPRDWYDTQHTMPSTGEIADAIIRLQDGYIVAVDAKFPLANYEAYAHEKDPAAKKRAASALVRDIKKHVSDISKKYIAPRDNTLDYAFMYIPMEGVYYETMLRSGDDSLWEYCLKHHVVPVSPNNFLAYLRTVLIGLRGMKIEQQAKEILESLSQVRRDFQQFGDDFTMVGKHLTNAKNRFEDSARRLDKFNHRLEQIEGTSNPELSPGVSTSVKKAPAEESASAEA